MLGTLQTQTHLKEKNYLLDCNKHLCISKHYSVYLKYEALNII